MQMFTQLYPQIEKRLGLSEREVTAFCAYWQIRELAVFGSILRDDFHEGSDIDLLISFMPGAPQGLLTLAKIKHDLEDKTSRRIDIAIKEAIASGDNWIRSHEILNTAQVIYEQG